MSPDFEVDAEALRTAAVAVDDLGARVAGAAGSAPPTDPSPRWAATGAALLATGTACRLLRVLGHDLGDTAGLVRSTADAYVEADARAAARLRAAR